MKNLKWLLLIPTLMACGSGVKLTKGNYSWSIEKSKLDSNWYHVKISRLPESNHHFIAFNYKIVNDTFLIIEGINVIQTKDKIIFTEPFLIVRSVNKVEPKDSVSGESTTQIPLNNRDTTFWLAMDGYEDCRITYRGRLKRTALKEPVHVYSIEVRTGLSDQFYPEEVYFNDNYKLVGVLAYLGRNGGDFLKPKGTFLLIE